MSINAGPPGGPLGIGRPNRPDWSQTSLGRLVVDNKMYGVVRIRDAVTP
jgi:hypothetical protein